MAAPTIQDLDPHFAKALGYFVSKDPDSTIRLKEMLDEAIAQNLKRKTEIKGVINLKAISKPSQKLKHSLLDQKKKDKEEISRKRDLEKIKKDLEDLTNQSAGKKMKMDLIRNEDVTEESKNIKTSDEQDFDLELPCAVCNKVSVDSNGNKPLECQECHNFFHQDCHQPPISDQDANDPRCIWYCARCTKNLKKMAKQTSAKSTGGKDQKVVALADSKNKQVSITPFKRHDIKTSLSSGGNNNGGSLSGWESLRGKPIAQPILAKSSTLSKKEIAKTKPPKGGPPKLAVSDAWAEALGAKVPSGSKSPGAKNWSAGSGKVSGKHKAAQSSVFPKAAATSVPVKKSKEEGASKRLQMVKKKAASKMQMKKNK